MNIDMFHKIYDGEIMSFIQQIQDNNSKIKMKEPEICKRQIYREYCELNAGFKEVIFNGQSDNKVLDRHKIASCICGAFLKVSVFDKTELAKYIKDTGKKTEAFFFYANELVAFYAGCRFLSFFMVNDTLKNHNYEKASSIIKRFPILPLAKNTTLGSYSNLLFYLSRIKDEKEIGLKHFDKYSYSWNYYMLEEYFNKVVL